MFQPLVPPTSRVYDSGMAGINEVLQGGVEKVLQSEVFRNAPSSRRLLRYLADHSLAADATHLKEYTIGVDAFGKPPEYDPRLDSTVRIQIGRLRQKLVEYYRSEGKDDEMVVDLPRGRFKLVCELRSEAVHASPDTGSISQAAESEVPSAVLGTGRWRLATLILSATLLVALAAGAWALVKIQTERQELRSALGSWTPELGELWQPLLGQRPLIVAVGNPLFLQFENKALYRDLSIEKWEDLLKSPNLSAINQALGSKESRPVHYYAAVGDVSSAFLLGQRLGPRQPNMSVARSSQLLWQQMADANVLFLGPPRFFGERLVSMPASLEITETPDGFRNVHPRAGEQELFKYREPNGFFAEDGEACVLITRTTGPEGNTTIQTFAGNSTFARFGAVKAFTDPVFVQTLVRTMRGSSAHLPRYFQVLLRVKYKGGVPTETTYLLHRELRRN